MHTCPTSYTDARTVNSTICSTYQQAALEMNLITDVNDARICFQQSLGLSTPHELRGLFTSLTTSGFPTLIIYNSVLLRRELMLDWLESGMSTQAAHNELLKDIQRRLAKDDKTPEMYGLKSPEGNSTELERERLQYDPIVELQKYELLSNQCPNNVDQQNILDSILEAVRTERKNFFFIDGPGGTGKTTIVKKIICKLRSEGKIVQVCASTTLAATLYENATTAHSLFKFPVEDDECKDPDERTCCKLKDTQRLELLKETHVIVWDEFVSNNKELFESVQRELYMCNQLIFICAGDFRQILPVVKRGTESECVTACISSSVYWPRFKIMRLTTNMRVSLSHETDLVQSAHNERQKVYAASILSIGEGRDDNFAIILSTDHTGCTMKVGLSSMDYFLSCQSNLALQWLYPSGFNSFVMQNTCILASKNDTVDTWNTEVQKLNPSVHLYELKSHDYLCDVDDPYGFLARCLSETVLNTFNASGVPKHTIYLKQNDICTVMRALKSSDVATNCRVRVILINTHIIKVQLLDESERIVLIPKIKFKFKLDYGESYQMMRCQFPLRLAYCMTYNKSQSQTFQKILLDCRQEPFTHGHLYVAMSRVRDCDNIKLFVTSEQLHQNPFLHSTEMPVITNVVYHKVLLN